MTRKRAIKLIMAAEGMGCRTAAADVLDLAKAKTTAETNAEAALYCIRRMISLAADRGYLDDAISMLYIERIVLRVCMREWRRMG